MAAWSDLNSEVAPELPGCPPPLIERAAMRTVNDFCERTNWLRAFVTGVDAPAGSTDQSFGVTIIPATQRLLTLYEVRYHGDKLDLYNATEAGVKWGQWWTQNGTPTAIVQVREDLWRLIPYLTLLDAASLSFYYSYTYRDTATTFDDILLTTWKEGLSAGIKMRLMAEAGKKWSNPDMAQVYARVYDADVATARVRASRGPTRQKLETKPYAF